MFLQLRTCVYLWTRKNRIAEFKIFEFLFNFERRAKIILWQLSVKKAGVVWPNILVISDIVKDRGRYRLLSFYFCRFFLFFSVNGSDQRLMMTWQKAQCLTEWWSNDLNGFNFVQKCGRNYSAKIIQYVTFLNRLLNNTNINK